MIVKFNDNFRFETMCPDKQRIGKIQISIDSGAMKKGIGVSGKRGMVRRGVGGARRPAKPKTDGKDERRGSWRRESSLSMRRKEGRRILEGVKGKSSASSQRPVR